MSIFEEP